MGRGLSALEQFILQKADENLKREGPRPDSPLYAGHQQGVDLYLREVLAGFYALGGGDVRENFGVCFEANGKVRAARAAVSRAFVRLERRGLVHRFFGRYFAGVDLTEAGRLMVDKRVTLPLVNR